MIVICGPTSSGKTSLAIKIAKEFGFEIVSADSRQIYKYMDIGTGKVPVDNKNDGVKMSDGYGMINNIKIWNYDLINPGEYFSVVDFKTITTNLYNDISQRKILVGGTGLYIDSIINQNFAPTGKPDLSLRDELRLKSVEELKSMIPYDSLNELNESDINNPTRLVRVIEKCNQNKLSSPIKKMPNYIKNLLVIYLSSNNNYLYSRVDMWVDEIFIDLEKEVKFLIGKGFQETPQMKSLIYKTMLSLDKGLISDSEAKQRIKYDLHSYIRRQKTWFNRYKFAELYDISEKDFDTKVLYKVSLSKYAW